MALFGCERRFLGCGETVGELCGSLGALLALGVVRSGGPQGCELAIDRRMFRFQPGEAPALLGCGGPECMAARVEVG